MTTVGEEMGNPNPRPMVEMEMDAALALAEMATTESGRVETKKRIKNSFPDLEISRPDKHACLVGDDLQDNKVSTAVEEGRVKFEQNSELSTSNNSCNGGQTSCFGRRTKQNMTEAEKEARRIRRVLANRESARQTIRRRQALQEELVKKVADLSVDNENMKLEKELAMKEYLSLKDRNKQLKAQILDRTVKCKVKVGVEIASTQPETSTSPSTELSLVSSSRSCHEEGNPTSASASKSTHFYAPWFYPLHHHHTSPSAPSFLRSSNDQDRKPVFQEADHSTYTSINLEELPTEYERPDNSEQTTSSMPSHGVAEREVALHMKAEKKAVPKKEQLTFIQSRKASVDPAVAAEARKRRKELKKLKFLHGRQIRLHG